MIRIQNDLAVDIARGAADGLDEGGLAAQEAFLVGVQDRDQGAFGNVEALAQQVDADQDVEGAQPQVADDLDALQGFDVGVHVAHADALLVHVFGEVLRHLLGQRGDEGAEALPGDVAAFGDQVVDLVLDRPYFDRWVDQSGRADHLLGEDAAGALHLPRAGRGADIDGGRAHRVPFLEFQRPVVDAGGQAEAEFGQRVFAAVIAFVHRADLRHRHMAFVGEHQRVVGDVFEQGRRRLAGLASRQPARIVLDAGAGAGRLDHLDVEIGALFQALGFEQLSLGAEFGEAGDELGH